MSESALRDGLTHAYNKRYFSERLESEFQYALRHDDAAVADLPRHRSLQAHQRRPRPPGGRPRAGRSWRRWSTSMLGEDEIFARYGGEEFAIIARGDGPARPPRRWPSASAPAVEAHPFVFGDAPIPVTISIGVSHAPGARASRRRPISSRAPTRRCTRPSAPAATASCVAQPQPPRRRRSHRHEAVNVARCRQRAAQARQVVGARDADRRPAARGAASAPARRSSVKPPARSRSIRKPTAAFEASVRAVEHRLAAEEAAQRDAVEPADQRRRPPRPRRCGRARAGAARCTSARSRRDPGRRPVGRRRRAGAHHAGEVAVDREPPPGAPRAARCAAVRSPAVEVEDRARIGRPPGDHRVRRPGKDARAVRRISVSGSSVPPSATSPASSCESTTSVYTGIVARNPQRGSAVVSGSQTAVGDASELVSALSDSRLPLFAGLALR